MPRVTTHRATLRTALNPLDAPGAAPGLWFCNWKIWLDARGRLDRALAPLGLRAREFWLLALAGAQDVSQHELAGLCGLDPSSLVPVLDGLERRGWLRRERNPRDRRIQWVRRTEAGDRLFARALPRAQRAEARQMAALPAADQRRLVAILRRLLSGLSPSPRSEAGQKGPPPQGEHKRGVRLSRTRARAKAPQGVKTT